MMKFLHQKFYVFESDVSFGYLLYVTDVRVHSNVVCIVGFISVFMGTVEMFCVKNKSMLRSGIHTFCVSSFFEVQHL